VCVRSGGAPFGGRVRSDGGAFPPSIPVSPSTSNDQSVRAWGSPPSDDTVSMSISAPIRMS